MTEVTLGAKLSGNIYLTPSGEVAVGTPLAMKEYIYNESRSEAGRDYLLGDSAQYDDTNVSVQMAVMAESQDAAISEIQGFADSFDGGTKTIGGHSFLYKSISGIQAYKEGIVLFTANLIKLAK